MAYRPPVYNFRRHPAKISIYSTFRVNGSLRAPRTPRILQYWRTRKLTCLTAFFRNRFYEIDRWYKARIDKPWIYPTCYLIDPDEHQTSLLERLREIQAKQETAEKVDIGLPYQLMSTSKESVNRKSKSKEENDKLSELAQANKLVINVEDFESNDSIFLDRRVKTRIALAEHFRIFHDLFHPDVFFHPMVDLQLFYPGSTADVVNPVFYGNSLFPNETKCAPDVHFPAEKDSLWTLLLINPDGNVYEDKKDVLHWMICNIPANQVHKGDVVFDYLQPLPTKGSGWHRMTFVLFKQNRKIDSNSLKAKCGAADSPSEELQSRTFNTPEFYLKHEDSLTPAGLAFFQTEWDMSVTKCFHEKLHLEQPIYDFEWPEPYFEPQEEFPADYKPFNTYLDKYRDYKEIDEELLRKRLKNVSPFKADPSRLKYPNIFEKDDKEALPTWQYFEKTKENLGYGKYKGLYVNRIE